MTNIKTTQLNGIKKQLESIPSNIQLIESYEEIDGNPLYEAVCLIDDAISELEYAIREAKHEK